MQKMNLGSKNTLKTIFMLIIPSMIAQLVNVLYNIVDRIYIGNIPEIGNIALVGIGVVAPISTLITSFGFLVGLGGAPLFSIALGEQDQNKARKILANGFLMLLILASIILVFFYIFMDQILYTFGATNDSFIYAKDYFSFYLFGAFFAILTLGLNQYLTAQGQASRAMLTTIIGCSLNVVLDPIFMFTLNLGVKGAAIATLICQIISFLFVVFSLLFNKNIKLTFGGYNLRTMVDIVKLGFSPFVIVATDSVVFIVLNVVLKNFASSESNANTYLQIATIVTAFESLITGPLLGISTGSQPILGFNYGAKNKELVIKAEKQIFAIAFIFCLLTFIFSFALSKPFASLFLNLTNQSGVSNDSIIDLASHYIFIYMIGIIPLAFQYCSVDGLTAIGKSKYSIWLSLFRKVVLLLPLTYIIPLITKNATDAFFSEPIADVISAIVSTTVFLIIMPKIVHKLDIKNQPKI